MHFAFFRSGISGGESAGRGGFSSNLRLGMDVGGILATMFVSGWYAFVTIPTGLAALVVFTIVLVVVRAVGRRREKQG